jgi:hypothetical protein
MPQKLHTLTSIARLLGRDYRHVRYHMSLPKPVAVVIISGRQVSLYTEDQFSSKNNEPFRVDL